jgi:hypothetical protein
MTIEKFIEENFDIYQDSSEWGGLLCRFTPKTDMGQLCIDYLKTLGRNDEPEDYADEEKTIPLYGQTGGIHHILNTFYNMNVSFGDIVWVIQKSKNKIMYYSSLED